MDSIPQAKRCPRCQTTKPLTEYHRSKRADGHATYCKLCWKQYLDERRVARSIPTPATKQCTRCGKVKSSTDYHKQAAQLDGLAPRCKACTKVYADAHYLQLDKDALRAYNRAQYKQKRQAYIARAKAAYQRDPARGKERAAAWNRAHPDKRRAYNRTMYARNPEPKRETWRRRYARKRAATVVPFTTAQLQAKLEYWGNRCWICGGVSTAVDHVKPLAKGGPHILANLRPICLSCNSRKSDKWPYPTGA